MVTLTERRGRVGSAMLAPDGDSVAGARSGRVAGVGIAGAMTPMSLPDEFSPKVPVENSPL